MLFFDLSDKRRREAALKRVWAMHKSKGGLQRLSQLFVGGRGAAAETGDHLPVAGDEEFVEVPSDLSSKRGVSLLGA